MLQHSPMYKLLKLCIQDTTSISFLWTYTTGIYDQLAYSFLRTIHHWNTTWMTNFALTFSRATHHWNTTWMTNITYSFLRTYTTGIPLGWPTLLIHSCGLTPPEYHLDDRIAYSFLWTTHHRNTTWMTNIALSFLQTLTARIPLGWPNYLTCIVLYLERHLNFDTSH